MTMKLNPTDVLVFRRDGGPRIVVYRPGVQPFEIRPIKTLHSPTGFEWGYRGSGPAELARHLVYAVLGRWPEEAGAYDAVAAVKEWLAQLPFEGGIVPASAIFRLVHSYSTEGR